MVRMYLLAALLILSACQSTKGSYCIKGPIRLSDKSVDALTDGEVADILSRNETGRKLCGWKP